jgi:hypothetical protein
MSLVSTDIVRRGAVWVKRSALPYGVLCQVTWERRGATRIGQCARRTAEAFGVWQRGQRSWIGSKLSRQLGHSTAME